MNDFSDTNNTQLANLEGKKILVVEDDNFLFEILRKKLSEHKCIIISAKDATEGLQKVESDNPDIVLLDLLLPGDLNGFEVLKRLKEDKRFKSIPVIILSNLWQKEDIDKGRELGAVDFLVKANLTLDEIVDKVSGVLKNAQ